MPPPPRNLFGKTAVGVDQGLDLAWTGFKVLLAGMIMMGVQAGPHKPISQLTLHQILKFYLVYDALYVVAVVWILWRFLKDRTGAVALLIALYAFQVAHAWIVTWPMYRPYTSLPYRKVEFVAYTVWKIAIAIMVVIQAFRAREQRSWKQGVTV